MQRQSDTGVEPVERRRVLAEGLVFAINAYLRSASLWNPTEMAAAALDAASGPRSQEGGPDGRSKQHAEELIALAHEIKSLRAAFEGDELVVYLDERATLTLVERMLRMAFASKDAAATAPFEVALTPSAEDDHDAALLLPNRSVYVKFVPSGRGTAEYASTYLRRAVNANPSEYWLFALNQETLDILLEPVFTEGRTLRGRLRVSDTCSVIEGIVGGGHRVTGSRDGGSGFRFKISKPAD